MVRTKIQAIKKAKVFLKDHPTRDVQIIKHTNMKKTSDLRYNFRFPAKTGKTNKIIFKKEY